MAEALATVGAAASIVQLAQVSAQIALKLNAITKQIKNAPKVFEEISREVSLTGDILTLLGIELDDHDRVHLHKPAAVHKTRALIKQCSSIYDDLQQKIVPEFNANATEAARSRAVWKKRLKMPFMIDELSAIRNRLSEVTTWLQMMLTLLTLGAQAKGVAGSEETREMMLEQRQMLEILMKETKSLRQQADLQGPNGKVIGDDHRPLQSFSQPTNLSFTSLAESSASTLVDPPKAGRDEATISDHNHLDSVASENRVHEQDHLTMPQGQSSSALDTRQVDHVPEEMSYFACDIKEQARLITDLLNTIDLHTYRISRRTRNAMHDRTRAGHVEQWQHLAQKHGYRPLMSLVRDFPEVLEVWSLTMFNAQSQIRSEAVESSSAEPTSKHEKNARATYGSTDSEARRREHTASVNSPPKLGFMLSPTKHIYPTRKIGPTDARLVPQGSSSNIASSSTPRIDQIREKFQSFHDDPESHLSRSQLDAEVDHMIGEVDTDADGPIDYDDFLRNLNLEPKADAPGAKGKHTQVLVDEGGNPGLGYAADRLVKEPLNQAQMAPDEVEDMLREYTTLSEDDLTMFRTLNDTEYDDGHHTPTEFDSRAFLQLDQDQAHFAHPTTLDGPQLQLHNL